LLTVPDKVPRRRAGVRRLSLLVLLTLVTVGWASSSVHVTKATGTLAFVRGGDAVYVVRADGSGLRRLTTRKRSPHEHLVEPAWSPDGRKVAYSSDLQRAGDTAYFDLFVMNADGSGQRRLTRKRDDDLRPVWSPDGRKIAFDHYNDGYNWIYVVDADGSGLRKLTGNFNYRPSWSPNGRRIAYVGRDGIRTMNPDGSGKLLLLRFRWVGFDTSPSWSPDGRRIAFASGDEVRVVSTDGTRHHVLVRSPRERIESIAWSPDGRKIVFASGEGDWEIYVVNADGSGLRNLTDNSRAFDRDPVWSPDGRAIAFSSDRGGDDEVYVINPDGSGPRNVSRSGAQDLYPAWSARD
jgi:Tol biopolymer transport system component